MTLLKTIGLKAQALEKKDPFLGSIFFGGLAVVTGSIKKPVLDPWLCAPDFHRVCLFGPTQV